MKLEVLHTIERSSDEDVTSDKVRMVTFVHIMICPILILLQQRKAMKPHTHNKIITVNFMLFHLYAAEYARKTHKYTNLKHKVNILLQHFSVGVGEDLECDGIFGGIVTYFEEPEFIITNQTSNNTKSIMMS